MNNLNHGADNDDDDDNNDNDNDNDDYYDYTNPGSIIVIQTRDPSCKSGHFADFPQTVSALVLSVFGVLS